jgi:PAS domain S-box-containing protein
VAYHAIVGADTSGSITHWSEGAERLFGHRVSEALGKSLELIIPEHLREAHREGFGRTMQDPVVRDTTLDIPVLLADGQVREHPVRLLALSDAFGTALGAVAIFSSEGVTGIPL